MKYWRSPLKGKFHPWTGLDWTGGWNLYDFKFYRLLQCLTWPPRAMLGPMIPHPTPFPGRLTVQETEKAGVSANDHNACQRHFWLNLIRIKDGFLLLFFPLLIKIWHVSSSPHGPPTRRSCPPSLVSVSIGYSVFACCLFCSPAVIEISLWWWKRR